MQHNKKTTFYFLASLVKIYFFNISILAIQIEIPGETFSLTDFQGYPLDHKLAKLMNFENGTFVEVGAFDGLTQSNTYLLEKFYHWSGILIEPSNASFKKLCNNRPLQKCFNCALGTFEENGTYRYGNFVGGPMDSFTRHEGLHTQQIFIRSLQAILDECRIEHINFFSLDVEGYEFNVLKGIDFNKTKFDYILIEINSSHYKYNDIISLLSENGYDLVDCLTKYNHKDNPIWDGTHNDYLFKRKDKN